MPIALETSESTGTTTAAARQATANFRANLSALTIHQPDLPAQIPNDQPPQTWLFARDGYLTTRSNNVWLSGCSVPLRTAQELLKKLELTGTLGCFLSPSHAAQIRAALKIIQPTQAILAAIPETQNLRLLLHCDDFSPEILAARLLFVSGPAWPQQMAALFQKYPGLPLPQQFLRTSLLDDAEMSDLSTEAQTIISVETARRSQKMPEILALAQSQKTSGPTIVLAGSRFNLADLSNLALRRALLDGDPTFVPFDSDHPLTAGPLALAEAAASAGAIVTADLFRADLANVVSEKTSWITWITTGRVAPPDPAAKRDAILLADPSWRPAALKAGWSQDRIQLAAWPQIIPPPPSADPAPVLGLLSDTRTIEIPQKVKDFSSQLLLWEFIEDELTRDPLSLGDDPDRYLNSRMTRFNIRDDGFDRPMFFDRLIAPAYKHGLALLLLKNGIRIALFGRGWTEFPELKLYAMGPIEDPAALQNALSHCRAILQAYPDRSTSIAGLPLPIIRTIGLHPARLLGKIRQTLTSQTNSEKSDSPPLDKSIISSLLGVVAPPAL